MTKIPKYGEKARGVEPVICYPVEALPKPDLIFYRNLRNKARKTCELIVPPRDARAFYIKQGSFFRITCVEGPQVGDLNLWNSSNLDEFFYSGKTRALHGTHLNVGDRMWSTLPALRPMATIIEDTLHWYGTDPYGGSVHDVIGTRCDPYTNKLLSNQEYHFCCHSNLTRAFAEKAGFSLKDAEKYIHDVLNVFMCTGFTRDTGQYFMKASPVRPGDYLEFFAEINLLGALSSCPGGDCSEEHSNNNSHCHPLMVEFFSPPEDRKILENWSPPNLNGYDGSHGV